MSAQRAIEIEAEFPEKLRFLSEPARYKVAYGGRGGAKSWGFGRALLVKGAASPLRIPCCREIQKSISDSVHQLLKDQIEALDLSGFYRVTDTYIEGRNSTLFTFHGLKHNIQNIKSLEGADICWVEEAQAVSKSSWNTLIPTIRKPGSEIWVSFNPELESDETYQRFVVRPPANAVVVKIDWRDNPWFPDVLRQEKDDLKARSEDEYLNVWEGQCKVTLDGAIYAEEIRQALQAGRFAGVPWNPALPVHTFWDLGRADLTAIWFCQVVGMEFHIIDYYENSGKVFAHYLKRLSELPYHWGDCWLPHDADTELLGAEKTIAQQARAAGQTVRIVPHLGPGAVAEGINMARTIFPRCFFDQSKCADGITALKHYRYDVDPDTKERSQKPLHDFASHAADAFRYMAVALRPMKPKVKSPKDYPLPQGIA